MQIHSGVGMFHRAGRFPAAEGIELPLSASLGAMSGVQKCARHPRGLVFCHRGVLKCGAFGHERYVFVHVSVPWEPRSVRRDHLPESEPS